MPKKFSKTATTDIEAVNIADKFVDRLEDFLESANDSINLDSLSRGEYGWPVVSKSQRTSICFDIVINESERTFVVRSLTIENTAGLPGKVLRHLAKTCDRFHLGMRNEDTEIPDRIKRFLADDIGCVPDADGRFIRPPH